MLFTAKQIVIGLVQQYKLTQNYIILGKILYNNISKHIPMQIKLFVIKAWLSIIKIKM